MAEKPHGFAFRMRRNASRATYLDPDNPDSKYLFNKWWAEGSYSLIKMDVSTDVLRPMLIGETDLKYHARWESARGQWLGRRTVAMTWVFTDQFSEQWMNRTLIGELSEDGSVLTWVNGSDLRYGYHQLLTHQPWYRCELLPRKCADSPVRYDHTQVSLGSPEPENHFVLLDQRYAIMTSSDAFGQINQNHFSFYVHSDGRFQPQNWLELETRPKRAFLHTHLMFLRPTMLRPLHARPYKHIAFFKWPGQVPFTQLNYPDCPRISPIAPHLLEEHGICGTPTNSNNEFDKTLSNFIGYLKYNFNATPHHLIESDGNTFDQTYRRQMEDIEDYVMPFEPDNRRQLVSKNVALDVFGQATLKDSPSPWGQDESWASIYRAATYAGAREQVTMGYNAYHESTVFRVQNTTWCLNTNPSCIGDVPCSMRSPAAPCELHS